jgi:hypothetical protein
MRRSGWRRPMVSRLETTVRSETVLLAQLLSCTKVQQTLGNGGGHLRDLRWMAEELADDVDRYLGQKKPKGM